MQRLQRLKDATKAKKVKQALHQRRNRCYYGNNSNISSSSNNSNNRFVRIDNKINVNPYPSSTHLLSSSCSFSSTSTSTASTASTAPSSTDENEYKTKNKNKSKSKYHNKNYLIEHYQNLVKNNDASNDIYQINALTQLDKVRNLILSSNEYSVSDANANANAIHSNNRGSIGDTEEMETLSFAPNFMNQVSSLISSTSSFLTSSSTSTSTSTSMSNINGVYLHGGVGCGKTFCMNLFYDSLSVGDNGGDNDGNQNNIISKQKVHFHSFMLNIHKEMHKAKMIQKIKGDVLPHIIQNVILPQGKIICFDEFQVTDVADALILRRLFTGLLQNGAVIVATSNRPPCDLYLNGLQRDLFLPFIDLLERKLDVVSMWESEVDYRLVQGENKARGVYFIGNGESDDDNDVNNVGTSGGGGENKKDFEKVFHDLTKGSTISSTTLLTQGRQVKIPKVAAKYNIARFSFDDLCREARGAADYLIIGDTYHTIFVEDVPQLTMNDVNLVRRFIIFVDSMYECHVKLIIHAATGPNEIFKVDLGNEFCDEAFAFDRTRSRLEEMGSDEYLKKSWVGSSSNSGSNSSLIEKSQSSNKN